tara:strand:- start:6465 stop:7295 length:831 start_codon:yes stop_codon:yes gene_type:complete
MGAHAKSDGSAASAASSGSDAPFSFVTPTDFVELPSKGKLYPEGHPLHNKEEIEIRYMTARDEDILTSKTLLQKGIAIERVLENVIVDKEIRVEDLLIGDKNAIIIATRITGYGEEYKTRIACPSCARGADYSFDLSLLAASQEEDVEGENVEATLDGTYIVTVPITGARVEIRLLTGADEAYLTKLAENKAKKKMAATALTDQFMRMVVSVNGDERNPSRAAFIQHMPARDSRYLRGIYEKISPNIDMTQTFICESCGFEQDMEVPLTVDFFWPK